MAEWRKKKEKKTDWGNFYRSEEEFEAMRWCIKNGITVGPLAAEKGKANPSNYFIEITIRGEKNKSPESFPAKETWKQIYKYYKYYYDKYRGSI